VLATLPDDFQERISNLAIVVEEWPAEDADEAAADAHGDLVEGDSDDKGDHGGDLLGLYQGVPYGDRQSGSYSMVLPDRVTIYRQPILAASRSEAAAREEIRLTVLHEIGHYFGLGDDELP
jgi:predicted Zn-dependent protease with MMP-like domain